MTIKSFNNPRATFTNRYGRSGTRASLPYSPPGLGSINNPASSAKALRDAGITTSGLYYITTGNLGVQQVYVTFDSFSGGGLTTAAWALVSRYTSFSYNSYNTYGYLDAIETTTFGTNATNGWWIDQNVSSRGWLNNVNRIALWDRTTGYWVTDYQSGTLWQTSYIHTTSSGYPSNVSYNLIYSSYNGSSTVNLCWCEATGCTEYIENNNASPCSGSPYLIYNDNYRGTSQIEIYVAQV